MKLKDILKTEKELRNNGYIIENNIIEGADINIVGHFGNSCSPDIWCKNVRIYGSYNNISNIGYILRAFVELFDLTEEDGYLFSKTSNIPCRVVLDHNGSKCIGFGHFMKDKFVLRDDFARITE